MSLFLRMGMSVQEVVERVTSNPAKALKLGDRAGSLEVGMPADITVFHVEDGEFELFDCYKQKRKGDRKIVPTLAFKKGERIDVDLARGESESNWFMQICEDDLPKAADRLSGRQREFLKSLHSALSSVEWVGYNGSKLNVRHAYELQRVFNRVQQAHSISLRDGLRAVYDSFLEHPFTIQIGLFLTRLERSFVLERLAKVANHEALVTA